MQSPLKNAKWILLGDKLIGERNTIICDLDPILVGDKYDGEKKYPNPTFLKIINNH